MISKPWHRVLVCSALALAFAAANASAQDVVPAAEAENGNLWFVELSGNPTADGSRLGSVQAEKAAFRRAAAAAGVRYRELRAFDVLFNGFSVEVNPAHRAALASLPGVKALWPVEVIQAPERPDAGHAAPDLDKAIEMTGAAYVQNTLGYTGSGLRVAVMDTGIDYDHPDLGGDGVARSNSDVFPTVRVVAGWDFVGDAFTAGLTPVPDAYPDDCNGHGTHVSGIVGANGSVVGVAPGVVFGAYRVFGCDGSTTSDIMLAAMERALADDMHVLNMSIGSRAQWPQYPTGAAATRLQKKGMVVVASIGNNGPGGSAPDGPFAAGAPGVGHDVIGVASHDNAQLAFRVSPGDQLFGYNAASGAPAPPTSGSLSMAKTGTTASAADGCSPADFASFPAGAAALIRLCTCSFYVKASNAQSAGAAAVVLYNNAAGALNPTVAGTPPITIPVVAITAAQGAALDGLIAGGPTTLTWTDEAVSYPQGTGGLISAFSSFGMAPDLTLKPDLSAPGGGIRSTIPLEAGTYGFNSGTSMSSPHVAGAVALLLQAEPQVPLGAVRSRLQNSAKPTSWAGNPGLGFLDNAHRQGAGLLDIADAILATVDVTPGKLELGESQAGPQTRRLTLKNRGGSAVTLGLSHAPALATGPKSQTSYPAVSYYDAFATAQFSSTSVTVPAGGSRTVDVTFTAPAGPDRSQYGGYVVLAPQGGGPAYRVPYAGFTGDYQTVPVLTPTPSGFPWLAKLSGTTFINQPAGASYTMVDDDVPYFLVHLDHQSRYYEFRVFNAATGKPVHPVFANFDQADYVTRNTSATGFFAFAWDGTRSHDNGKGTPDHRKLVPNGDYIVQLRILKALGDPGNPAHWETWTSPVVTLAR
jgi:subtilisin family serine protease